MPLLEIKQVRHICASVWLDQDTVAQVDRYPAFIRASADDVVDKALIRYGGEGVIGFHISWQCKNGALHRKNGGHVTPKRELQSNFRLTGVNACGISGLRARAAKNGRFTGSRART